MLLIAIIGHDQDALSQDKTGHSYDYYDGNYILPSVAGSSYPAGYQSQLYFIPAYRWNSPPAVNPRSTDGPVVGAWRETPSWNQGRENKNIGTPSLRAPLSGDDSAAGSIPSTVISDETIQISQADQDAQPPLKEGGWQPLWGVLSEIRLGAGRHDSAVVGRRKENGIDLDAELLFASPAAFDYIWSPRPTLGLHANIKHKNNTSQIYGGLTWEWWPLEPIFINFFFGFSYHNGKTETTDPHIKSLGSLWLFRESLSIGWQTAYGFNISAYLDHASNGMLLAKTNEGIDTLGIRLGYRF